MASSQPMTWRFSHSWCQAQAPQCCIWSNTLQNRTKLCDKWRMMDKWWIPLTCKSDVSANEVGNYSSRDSFAWLCCLILAFEIAQLKTTSAIIESSAIPSINESESGMGETLADCFCQIYWPKWVNGWMDEWINSQILKWIFWGLMELKGWHGLLQAVGQDRKRNENNSCCTCVAVVSCCSWLSGSQPAMVLGAKSRRSGNRSDGQTEQRKQKMGPNSEMGKGKICNTLCNSQGKVWDMWGGMRGQSDKQECKGRWMLESKWQRGKWQRRGLCGGVIAWLRRKCTAVCVMLSRRVLWCTARLTQLLPHLSFSRLLHSASLLFLLSFFPPYCLACAPCPLIILSSCHAASLSDAHWQSHSCRNTAAPFQVCCDAHTWSCTQTHTQTDTHTWIYRLFIYRKLYKLADGCVFLWQQAHRHTHNIFLLLYFYECNLLPSPLL